MVLARRLLGAGHGGGSFAPAPLLSEFALTSAPEGGWSWFADPRAVHYNGTTYMGWVNGDGDVIARSYDHSTSTLSAETVLSGAFEEDDHANPSFLVRDSDKKIIAFYSLHDDTVMRLRISSSAESIAAFGAETNTGSDPTDCTYPNPVQLTGEANDPIYLFYRDIVTAGEYDLVYAKSTDGGASWSAQVKVVTGEHSYWKITANGTDRIDFAYTDEHPYYADGSLYHFYYQGGSYYKSDGTSAGGTPLDKSDMTLVYDGTGAAIPSWVWDIAVEPATGYPIIVYATFASDTDHRYNYARWSGSAWETHQIAAGGTFIKTSGIEVNYSGGVVLDHSDPRVVYCAIGKGGDEWDIHRYHTDDHGASWSSYALTSSGKNVRPVVVRDHAAGLQVLWMKGTYTTFLDYSVGTSGAGT